MIKRILKQLGFGKAKAGLSQKFTEVYEKNLFMGKESISGSGSDLFQTRIIREEIPKLLKKYSISSLVDAPCGDLYWMRNVDLAQISYTGVDIVKELINQNNRQFGSAHKTFLCVDIVKEEIPKKVDLIFCRDCLVHLTDKDAKRAVKNFASSGANFLLTTTFPLKTENQDLGNIIWRPLNLQLPPFSFPEPIELINEGCTENDGIHADKSLGLWKLSDLEKALAL